VEEEVGGVIDGAVGDVEVCESREGWGCEGRVKKFEYTTSSIVSLGDRSLFESL